MNLRPAFSEVLWLYLVLLFAPSFALPSAIHSTCATPAGDRCFMVYTNAEGDYQRICFNPCTAAGCEEYSVNIPGHGSSTSCKCSGTIGTPICCKLYTENQGGFPFAYGLCGPVCGGGSACNIIVEIGTFVTISADCQ